MLTSLRLGRTRARPRAQPCRLAPPDVRNGDASSACCVVAQLIRPRGRSGALAPHSGRDSRARGSRLVLLSLSERRALFWTF